MSGESATRSRRAEISVMASLMRPASKESYKPVRVTVGSATDKGLRRSWNEDEILSKQFDVTVNGKAMTRAVLAVADGVGGIRAGDIASKMAIDAVDRNLTGLLSKNRELEWEELNSQLKAVFKDAMSEIEAYSKRELGGERVGTTLTTMVIDDGIGYIGHIGDSKAYIIRNGRIRQITTEHDQKETGHSNILTRGLATGMPEGSNTPDISSIRLEKGDTVVLCSDGLENSSISNEMIGTMVLMSRTLQNGCDRLVKLANENGGRDNVSVVVARVE